MTAIDNSGETQRMQMTALKGETLDGVERFQEYGFEGYPKVDGKTENIVLFFNGNRDYGVVIKSFNKSFRPKDLVEGEVCMYDWQGHRITIKKDGTIKSEGNFFHMLGATQSFLNGDIFDTWLTSLKTWLITHIHPTPAGPSSPPSPVPAFPPGPTGHLSTKIKGQ